MARRKSGPVTYETKVVVDKQTLKAIRAGISDGLLEASGAGMHRALEYARSTFKTVRSFEASAFAVAFDEHGVRVGQMGDNIMDAPDAPGPIGYFGYAPKRGFIPRFHETGTARMPARPTLAPAQADMEDKLPGYLRSSMRRKGL